MVLQTNKASHGKEFRYAKGVHLTKCMS